MKKLSFLLLTFAFTATFVTQVQAQALPKGAQCLFDTFDGYHVPYRIPAITTTRKGHLIAITDRRYCILDIGYGKIDIAARTSKNNGRTWSADTVIQRGSGIEGSYDCGYGDVAVVADRTSNRILCMSVTGNVIYIYMVRARSPTASPAGTAPTVAARGPRQKMSPTRSTKCCPTRVPCSSAPGASCKAASSGKINTTACIARY